MDERVNELESKLAFTERLLDQLNEVVTGQEKRIAVLEATVVRLEEQLSQHGGAAPSAGCRGAWTRPSWRCC